MPMTDQAPEPQTDDAVQPEPVAAATVTEDKVGEDEQLVLPGFNWFVLRVASNKENYVKTTLLRKIKIEGYDGSNPDKPHLVNRILVPTEKSKTIKAGKQKVVETKLYPGYVFVEMKLEEDGRIPQDIFFLIKETTGVGDFIGTAGRPSPMSIPEIEKMLIASKPPEEQPQVKMEFEKGDNVKIREGPFENMEGTIDELLPDQGKVRVIVTIFGRATPVELEYWLIERVEE
ncbi:MAG: transcription termination/antitermination factor NusG [Planctomycetes bacterium]|nr:transcription termination/antitermination factor NusG [Planctomycetota bacterium]